MTETYKLFYTTEKVNLKQFNPDRRIFLLPIYNGIQMSNRGAHFMLGIADLHKKIFYYFDSIKKDSKEDGNFRMRQFLKVMTLDHNDWTSVAPPANIQKDSFNCGTFVIHNATTFIKEFINCEDNLDIKSKTLDTMFKEKFSTFEEREIIIEEIYTYSDNLTGICVKCNNKITEEDFYKCHMCNRSLHIQCFENPGTCSIIIDEKQICFLCVKFLRFLKPC